MKSTRAGSESLHALHAMFLNLHLHISHGLADVKPVNLFNLEMKVLLSLSFLL